MSDKCTNNVRKVRQEHSMTQKELADTVGVTRQTIIAIERGNYTPSVALALRIARVFRVCCEDLFHLAKSL